MDEKKPTQQQVESFMLADYAKKREKGIITFERRDGVVVMMHKQFDTVQNEVEPLQMMFSSSQMEKIVLGRDQQKLQLRSQILDLKEKLENIEREDEVLYTQLKRDVLEASQGEVPDGE